MYYNDYEDDSQSYSKNSQMNNYYNEKYLDESEDSILQNNYKNRSNSQ